MQSRLDAFRQQRDALQKRLSDPERAFREHMQRGTQLARILADAAERHAIGENRMNSAMQVFESFSYDEVMALFRETERLLLVQAASSAYAQGLIEEDAVNLNDALDHYKRTYDLDSTLEHQEAYARFCWQMGYGTKHCCCAKVYWKRLRKNMGRRAMNMLLRSTILP